MPFGTRAQIGGDSTVSMSVCPGLSGRLYRRTSVSDTAAWNTGPSPGRKGVIRRCFDISRPSFNSVSAPINISLDNSLCLHRPQFPLRDSVLRWDAGFPVLTETLLILPEVAYSQPVGRMGIQITLSGPLRTESKSEVAQSCPILCNPMDCQAPLYMRFSRQEYWSGLPFPSPRDLPNPGIKPRSSVLQADSLPSEPLGNPFA